jgi:hypothetical protein
MPKVSNLSGGTPPDLGQDPSVCQVDCVAPGAQSPAGDAPWPEPCARARPGARAGAHSPGEGAWIEVAGAGGEREG